MKPGAFWNSLLLPVRMALPHEVVNKLGLRSLRDERCSVVMRHARGRLLDIGCGNNQLAAAYGQESVGVDVHDFGGGAVIVEDSSRLPFPGASFETVSFVASLNHIPSAEATLREAHRVLRPGGVLLVTMLSPIVGRIRHRLAGWDEDQRERGMKPGELMGMSRRELVGLVEKQGFRLVGTTRFICWANCLYVFSRG